MVERQWFMLGGKWLFKENFMTWTEMNQARINEDRFNEYSGMIGVQFDEYPTLEPVDIHGIHWPNFTDKLEEPQPTPEPQPALPVEVYHTVKFNESAAWEAVVALSRGC